MIGRSWELVEVRVEGSARSRVVRGDDPDTLVVVDLDGGEGLSATFPRSSARPADRRSRTQRVTPYIETRYHLASTLMGASVTWRAAPRRRSGTSSTAATPASSQMGRTTRRMSVTLRLADVAGPSTRAGSSIV